MSSRSRRPVRAILTFARLRPLAAAGILAALFAVSFIGWIAGRTAVAAQVAPKKAAAKPKTPIAPPPLPIEQRPYRVRFSVAFAGSTSLLPELRRRILRSLQSETERGYGLTFHAEYRENDWISPASDVGLQRLEPQELLERFPGAVHLDVKGFEKVFLLTVEALGPQFRIACREWDARSQKLGPVLTVQTSRPREVGLRAFSLIPKLFRPVLEIDTVKPKNVQMRLQAGFFVPLDPALAQVRRDDIVVPYFRYADKKDIVKRVQTLPWTYGLVSGSNGTVMTADVISPYFSNPLGSGRRRNVQILATRIRPHRAASRVKMVYQTDQTKPLIGYNVQLVMKRHYRDDAKKPTVTQFSGRDGFVHVPVVADEPITWLYVYSGSALLARVPYVPGVTTDETLPLPDDSIRLAVEGDIDLLKGKLIDVVARRATLKALAQMADTNKKLTDAQKRKTIDERFKELYALPRADYFLERLVAIREPGLESARNLKNKFAERRIKKLCDDTETLIKRYLDMTEVEKFRNDLAFGKR